MAATDRPPSSNKITTEVLAARKGIKIIRMRLPAGFSVPEHHANVDIVATVVRGTGTFTVADEPRAVGPGSVIEMRPGVRHAVRAADDEELELIITHARLERADVVDECG